MMDETSTTAESGKAPGVTSGGAPVRVAAVALTVRDIDAVSRFYRDVVGLAVLSDDGEVRTLGAGATALLDLRRDGHARREDPRSAGLFHTAFLLPTRSALADWLRHAAETGARIDGASDHLVSEAFYLSDPEGTGVEIYADRPSASWGRRDGMVEMATAPLDLQALGAASTGRWSGAPEATIVGHVHLRAGDLAAAERFYVGALGLDVACRYPGATFFGSGGYHHHIATNIWNSRGAPVRPDGVTGLAEIRLLADAAAFAAIGAAAGAADARARSDSVRLQDPGGVPISVSLG